MRLPHFNGTYSPFLFPDNCEPRPASVLSVPTNVCLNPGLAGLEGRGGEGGGRVRRLGADAAQGNYMDLDAAIAEQRLP